MGVLIGVVSTYDTPYPIGGGFREQIAPGAFDASFDRQETIPVYYQHGHLRGDVPIGVATRALGEDGRLTVRAELFLEDNPDARVVHKAAKAGALREWSVGMYYRGDPSQGDVSVNFREKLVKVLRADLGEVSVVLRGANPETSTLDVRSLEEPAEAKLPGDPQETDPFAGRSSEELAQFLLDTYR